MVDDELTKLLQLADRDPQRVVLDGAELAARVRKTHRRRRVRHAALATGLPVIMLLGGIAIWSGQAQVPRPVTIAKSQTRAPASVASLAEIEQLEAAAALHQQRARAMMVDDPAVGSRTALSAEQRVLLNADPVAELRQQVDVVAYRMILRADSMIVNMRPSAEAIEIYRSILRHFPQTYSAEVASQRLEQAVHLPGESS